MEFVFCCKGIGEELSKIVWFSEARKHLDNHFDYDMINKI